ncbi:MAG: SUMF1/EgtB/PvdO family nonheme iron enzyme [Verrucomicrobiae bacterium]|nr:SUMF1/EgtB/PvdO family nonheme iron enzyme [Verrucomicrobiae bacterium]
MQPNGLKAPLLLALCICILAIAGSTHAAVTMTWLTVGNPGNPNDTADGAIDTPGVQNFGMVTTTYRIAAHEVTNAQYTEFLNNVDPNGTNPNGIYHTPMGITPEILFSAGNAPGTKYWVNATMENRAVQYVNWFDAARFANWMHNGQVPGSTETGAYNMTIATPVRLAGATVFLPTEDEWYKAAYFDPVNPTADEMGSPDYWSYPTMHDSRPIGAFVSATGVITNPGPNVVNYDDRRVFEFSLSTVGSASATSYYGAFDMAGNVWEWNEAINSTSLERGIRGGSYGSGYRSLSQSSSEERDPTFHGRGTGFRLASIPEPPTGSLMLISLVTLASRRRR